LETIKKIESILLGLGAILLAMGLSYPMLPALAVTYGPAYPGTTMALTGISSVTCTPMAQSIGGAVNLYVGVKDFHKAGQGYDFRVTITDEDTGAVLDTSWMGHVYAYETAGHNYVFVMPNQPWNLKVDAYFSGYPGDTNNPAHVAIDLVTSTTSQTATSSTRTTTNSGTTTLVLTTTIPTTITTNDYTTTSIVTADYTTTSIVTATTPTDGGIFTHKSVASLYAHTMFALSGITLLVIGFGLHYSKRWK